MYQYIEPVAVVQVVGAADLDLDTAMIGLFGAGAHLAATAARTV
jgi:hypothetical protein